MYVQKKWLLVIACSLIFLMTIFNKNDVILPAHAGGDASTIAGIIVDDLSTEEIEQVLNKAIMEWGKNQIIVQGGGQSLKLNVSNTVFDIEATLANYEANATRHWYTFWSKPQRVALPLKVKSNTMLKEQLAKVEFWNADATYEVLMAQAAYLDTQPIDAVIDQSVLLGRERIYVHTEPIIEKATALNLILEKLNDRTFEANEVVSFFDIVNPNKINANPETVDFFASLMYAVALYTNSEILERTSQKQIPSYLKPGIEATVSNNGKTDLKFRPIEALHLKMTQQNEKILIEVYSETAEQKDTKLYTSHEIVSPRVITRFSPKLAVGEVKLVQQEIEGARYTVKRMKRDGSEELISKDYYPPQNRIVLKSSMDATGETSSEQILEQVEKGVDLNGDGLIDFEGEELTEEELLEIDDTVYDKSGNIISK